MVVFHFSQLSPGRLYERRLLVDGVLHVFDNLPDLFGCHSSAAGSGIGRLHGFRGRVGLFAFHLCMSPGPDCGRWLKVFLYADPCASSRICGGKVLGSPPGWVRHPSGVSSRSAHNTIMLYRNNINDNLSGGTVVFFAHYSPQSYSRIRKQFCLL